MSPTFQALGIDRMTREQRLELVQEIWDSIAAEPTPVPLSDALHEELLRRNAEDDANPEDVVPWEQVKAEIFPRLK